MTRLYELSDQYQFLLTDLYNEETGEVDETVLAKLNEISDTAENKCINITRLFKELQIDLKGVSDERKRLAKKESSLKKKVDELKDYLLENMERCEIKKISCPQFVISLQNNPPKTDPYDETLIPDEYKKITIEFDLTKMRQEMMNGVVIPGARLVQSNSVRIR
jgi:predicted nuclease with TOPRIM domain